MILQVIAEPGVAGDPSGQEGEVVLESAAVLEAAQQRNRRLRALRRNIEGYLVISPWLVGLIVFTAGPMLASLVLALMRYDLLSPPKWVGLGNFARLGKDRLFTLSLYNTAYYSFLSVPAQLLVALTLALFLNMKVPGVDWFRSMYYLPTITPAVASVILWMWIFNPEYGLANTFLRFLHIPAQGWLWDPKLSKPSIVIMSLWGVGRQMVIFLGGLQGVPKEMYEAAMIDGAGGWRRLLHITLPLISPITFFNLVMGIIGTFQVFTAAFIATEGGPINSTLFYVLHLYRHAFENFRMGYACVLAWVLFVIMLALTLVQFRISGGWVYYDSARSGAGR